jgi:hypothetical protein
VASGRIGARSLFVHSKHAEHLGYSLGHWSTSQYHDIDKENSFVGIVAQGGILKYVKAKALANKNLLEPAPGRISLLENAVFPGLNTVGSHTGFIPYNYFLPPELGGEEQLRIVQFLLDASDTRYKTAFGDSIYDMAIRAQRADLTSRDSPPPEWYTEVLELLEKHGYSSAAGTVGSQGSEKAKTTAGSPGPEKAKTTAGSPGPEKAKMPRLSLRRIITKLGWKSR